MEDRQGVMCPNTRSTTKRAGQQSRLSDGGQDGGHAPLQNTVTEARPPEGAHRLLVRLRAVGPTPWRGPIPRGVPSA
jgi:hypothetical protein